MKDTKSNKVGFAPSESKPKETDPESKHKPVDEGFKTSSKKYVKQEWREPLDEQQFDGGLNEE